MRPAVTDGLWIGIVAAVATIVFLTAMDNIAKGLTAAPEERNQSMEEYTNGQVLLPSGD